MLPCLFYQLSTVIDKWFEVRIDAYTNVLRTLSIIYGVTFCKIVYGLMHEKNTRESNEKKKAY